MLAGLANEQVGTATPAPVEQGSTDYPVAPSGGSSPPVPPPAETGDVPSLGSGFAPLDTGAAALPPLSGATDPLPVVASAQPAPQVAPAEAPAPAATTGVAAVARLTPLPVNSYAWLLVPGGLVLLLAVARVMRDADDALVPGGLG